jgi:flagellar biogenesis protein FliO
MMKDFMKCICALAIIFAAFYLVLKLADRFCGTMKRSYMTVD